MTGVDQGMIAASVLRRSLAFVEEGSSDVSLVPEQWHPILLSADAESRRQTALALWNRDFLDLVPRFARALHTHLEDVRVCIVDDCPALVYVTESDDGECISWVGYDPRSFGDPPLFWDSFPDPLQVFLRKVHAGFTSGLEADYGPMRPEDMDTIANLAYCPEGIPGWEEISEIASTRLLQFAADGGLMKYCVSPDLTRGEIALVYEGTVDARALGVELDELLMMRFEPA
jgi:hypothetical protein